MAVAAHVVRASFRSSGLVVPVRFYGLQHKMTKDERHELAEYRRKVTELRKEFRKEWMEKVRCTVDHAIENDFY